MVAWWRNLSKWQSLHQKSRISGKLLDNNWMLEDPWVKQGVITTRTIEVIPNQS